MHLPVRLLTVLAIALAVGACAGSAATPSSQASADSSDAWLRAMTFQALPPATRFAVGPTAVITSDGSYVTEGPADATPSGPLLPNLIGRPISDAGRQVILAEAGRLGLLGGKADFRSVAVMPGGVIGRLQLTVDGSPITLIGEPDSRLLCLAACDPFPGSPEAFGELWRMLADPTGWLAADLGAGAPFVADSYALLTGPAPAGPASGASVQVWPLATQLATFGEPVSNSSLRCGIVAGKDAETLRPALQAATQATRWVQDPGSSATFGLIVRPIVAGEDPCREVFGVG